MESAVALATWLSQEFATASIAAMTAVAKVSWLILS